MRPILLTATVVLAVPALAPAQVERYELGRRLKRFERAWETANAAGRKRALAILPKASTQFLTLQLAEAARTVDDAWQSLGEYPPLTAAERYARSLCAVPERRVSHPREPLVVEVRQLYPVPADPPNHVVALADVYGGPGGGVAPYALPRQMAVLNMPEVRSRTRPQALDAPLTVRYRAADRLLDNQTVTVSFVTDLDARLRAAAAKAAALPALEAATATARVALLKGLVAGDVPETDVPAGALLRQTEEMPADRPYFTPDCPGDHWLAVPTGKDITPCRLFVPDGLSKDKPVPLVVALHGAGGSENMFFESYGAGHIVKECQKRGWLLVAPRCGLLGLPPVAEVVDKLAERYPIDPKRVFLVGHSLGAGQAVELVQKHPGRFAAVAVLGGGGRVRKKELFADLPVFVGMGTADFALRSGKAFVKALGDAGARRVTVKEYDGLEHLLIVREALPDVFAGWDALH